MLTARWLTLGPPVTPRVSYVRGVGKVRVTQQDIDRYAPNDYTEEPEVVLERVLDDPEARFRIAGVVPKPAPAPKRVSTAKPAGGRSASRGSVSPKRRGKRGLLARLFAR